MRRLVLFLAPALLQAADTIVWDEEPGLPEPLGVAGSLLAAGAHFPASPFQGGVTHGIDRAWALDDPRGVWRNVGQLPRPLAYGVSTAVLCAEAPPRPHHPHAPETRSVANRLNTMCARRTVFENAR